MRRRQISLSEFKKLLLKEQESGDMDISVARQIIRKSPLISSKYYDKPLNSQEIPQRSVIIFGSLADHEKQAICSLEIVSLGGKRPFLARLPENCISDEAFVAKYAGEYFLCDTGGYDYARHVVRLGGFDESACLSDEDYMVSKMV